MIKVCSFDNFENREVSKIRITNVKGEYIEVLDFGATLYSCFVRDKQGTLRDVVLGFDTVKEYFESGTCFGATVGRVANRISGAKFTLNGKEYNLFDNTGTNTTLHGGKRGWHKKMWSYEIKSDNSVKFTIFSPDGDENFPGNMTASVTYTFTDDSQIILDYCGSSDADTLFNITNHSYFNLDGQDAGTSIYDNYLKINSNETTPLGKDFTPTGEFVKIAGTPYDFSDYKKIGRDIESNDAQMELAAGYDINYVINKNNNDFTIAAQAYSENTGISLKCETDMPGVQLYVGNFIDNGTRGKNGAIYNRRHGFALETQFFPDAVNKKSFKNYLLKKGEKFESRTVFEFGLLINK